MNIFNLTQIQKRKRRKDGFTLVETIVAISILLLALEATMFATTRGILTATAARDQVVAFYLAQEAIEFVKNKRDENILYNIQNDPDRSWLHGLDECMGANVCMIDVADSDSANQFQTCGGGDCSKLFLSNEGVYNLPGETGDDIETIYSRSINIQETALNQEAVVTVTMKWKRRAFVDETIETRVNMFNTGR